MAEFWARSGPACLLPFLASFLLAAAETSFSGVWYLVNVNSVVCPGSPGYAVINMTEPTAKTHSPHILTVFRTTNASVTLRFEVTDATGKVITDQSAGISLRQVSRRLGESWLETEETMALQSSPEELEAAEAPAAPPRQLGARRRSYGGGGGYSSPRRRVTPPASYSSPRRRTPAAAPSPAAPAGGASARRRGYTEPPSQRRRTAGYDNKYYSNPSNPGAGSYGYVSQSAAMNNYGGRLPTSTPYGYTGANAYSGSSGSGMQIALAAGGGLLAGMAVSSLMHHSWTGYSQQQMLSMPCSSGSWSGLCSTCMSLHGANNCEIKISPKIDATRDDLLNTGFIPADFSWPIHVKITSITGMDFDPSSICPPTDPGNLTQWSAPPMKQLFLTLTTMEELSATPPAATSSSGSFLSSMWSSLIAALCLCCCCCAAGAFWMSRSKRNDWESGTSSESDSDGHPIPGQVMAHGRIVQPAGYAQNPYWQGGAPAGSPPPAPPAGAPYAGAPYAGAAYAGAPFVATSFVQGSPSAYPQPFQSGGGFAGAGFVGGGFMDTAAPVGASWADVCRAHPVSVDSSTMMLQGPWGECLAWAVAYEHQNPGWESDPRFQEGPAQQVINAMLEHSPESMAPSISMAAENLEQACHQAVQTGTRMPLINQIIR